MNIIVDLADERFLRNVERLHQLGPRPLFELFVELGCRRMLRVEIERLVGRYARLDPAALRVASGEGMPPSVVEASGYLERALGRLRDAEAVTDDVEALYYLNDAAIEVEDARVALGEQGGAE